jgi:hypothetical protein
MSGKQQKKIRQLYRKDLGKKAEEQKKLVNSKIEEFTKQLDIVLKPAPVCIPDFIWMSLQRLFLNI